MRVDRRTLALAGLLGAALLASALHSPDRLLAAAESVADDPAAFGAVVVGLYLLRPLVLWPTTLVAVVVGFGFGVAAGVPIALAGAVLTSAPPFYAARWLGGDAPSIGRLRAAGERFFEATGDVRGVTAGRLAPVPADAVTVAAALGGVPFGRFAAGVLVGELPWTVAAVVVGASLMTVSSAGADAVGVELAAATALAAAVLLAGPAYRWLGDDRATATADQ